MVYKSTNFISRYMSDVMEQAVTIDTAKELGLLPEEFQKIKEYLGRTPNFTELSIYSVMWSEHCSYKNSIVWLKTLPKDGPHMLVAAGEENAGLVGIGDGLACACEAVRRKPLRYRNKPTARKAARLLPSTKAWFFARPTP